MVSNYNFSIRQRRLFLKLFFFAALALLFGVQRSSATHLAGGNITYTCTTAPNTYQVKASIYRDCAGIALSPPPLIVRNTCTNTQRTVQPSNTPTAILVTQPCNSTVLTRCNGGIQPGIQRYDYLYTVTLTAAELTCNDIVFAFDVSARNQAITTLNNPGGQNMRLEAHVINQTIGGCITSPAFNIDPILFLCLNQQNCFNFGATFPAGDSISYAWMTPLQLNGALVNYLTPAYDSAHAITGIQTLNPTTGDICLTPTVAGQVAVMAIKITQRRLINGVWTIIGTVERDIQMYMVSCTNDLPTLTGVDGDTIYTKNACAGGQVCFNVYSNDTNLVDSTKIIIPPNSLPSGATFTITPGKRSFGTYCMPTTAADAGKNFSFTLIVRDNACPQNGQSSYTYSLNLFGITATTTSTSPKCFGGNNGTATITATGTAPFTYTWNTNPVQTTQAATGLGSGTYCATATATGGCSVTQCVTVNIPTPLIATATNTNANCNGGTNGTATVNSVSGGTGLYSYQWSTSPVQTSATALNLAAGSYCATVTDANGCTTTQCVNITQPSAMTATTSNTLVSCFGGANGTASVTVGGGTPGYKYVWSPGAKTTQSIVGAANTYTVIVTDLNGCTLIRTETISQPTALVVSTTNQQDITCTNLGSFDIVPSGGTPIYTYATNSIPAQTTSSVTNLGPGSYTITVRDQKGCRASNTVTIGGTPTITATEVHTDPLCNGAATGTATITATGSTGYTYTWTPNVSNSNVATGLAAGTYIVDIRAGNCLAPPVVVVITEPAALTATQSHTDVSCNGGNNGTASVVPTGGTGAYTYSWSPSGGNSSSASGLTAGTYVVSILDANNCPTSETIIITEPTAVTSTQAHINVSCNNGNDGTASVTASGGTGAFTYAWSPNVGNTASVSGLTAGTYIVSATDANNCSTSQTIVITEPTAVTETQAHTNVSCNGGSDGTASVTASGGTGAYSYTWSPNVSNTSSASGLAAGTYVVSINDANNCATSETIIVTQPVAVTSTQSHTNVSCNAGTDGTASVTASGGTGAYSYNWSPNVSNTSSASGLTAGTYIVIITDVNNCSTSETIVVTEPTVVTSTQNHSDVSCNGGLDGTASVTANGGSGTFTYTWTPNVSNSASANGLAAGTYIVSINDVNNCSTSQTIVIGEPTAVVATETHVDVKTCSCSSTTIPGSIDISASGGTPGYTYQWNPSVSNTSSATGLVEGTYTVIVSDSKNCSTTKTVVIGSSAAMVLSFTHVDVTCQGGNDGSITATVTGGVAPYTYLWGPTGATTAMINGLTEGNYVLRVKDALGCLVFDNVTVGFVSPCVPQSRMATYDFHSATLRVFPNPTNDFVNVNIYGLNSEVTVKLELSDILGKKIESRTEKSGDDYAGTINLTEMPSGIYMLRVQFGNEVKTVKVIKD